MLRCALLAILLNMFVAKGAAFGARHGIVSSGNSLATEAGLQVLRNGGNAIDAAVAVGFTLGVVDPKNSGLGGGCFMLIRLANGGIVAVDGRETAPAAATADMFLRNRQPDPALSQTGALASGVPGALAAYDFALVNYGSRSLAEVIAPAVTIAERGFVVDTDLAKAIKSEAKDIERFSASRELYLPSGVPLQRGARLRQTDLAESYRRIAEQGSDWFYRGPYAKTVEAWMKTNGGLLTAEDFANYRVMTREPLITQYRGYTIAGFPPPSSGGVHVAQILNMLEHFDLEDLDTASRWHVIAEAMKRAFADRAYWLGDPAFTDVPIGLVDREYCARLASQIRLDRATPVAGHGEPPRGSDFFSGRHTTHFCTADAEGNWVACTATINTTFGSKVIIPGTGILLNNEMDDFTAAPGVSNYFGLVGSKANAVAPGKRPLSSMSPTLVLKDGSPVYALGGAGGPRIISQVVMELVALLDLQASLREAAATPRVHQQWSPDELVIEASTSGKLRRDLELRGHKLKPSRSMGISHLIGILPDGSFVGAADPRGNGRALGF
jgi:gamma-glutamyltranspeptidase/glutathione hydrolase